MDVWYYARGNDRQGPVTKDELLALIAAGQVHRSALAWADGMPQWQAISQIPELNPQPPQHQLTKPVEPAVSYFSAPGLMPPRAQQHLRGHAPATGDVGTWPLNDANLTQFKEALRIRRPVTAAARLYLALLFLVLMFGLSMAIAAAVNVARDPTLGLGLFIFTIASAIVCGLYWALWRYTLRSHRWAPMLFLIVCLTGVAITLLSLSVSKVAPSPSGNVWIGAIIVFLIGIAFAFISWRAFAAIPKYRAQPAWCQELIASAGL